jgi:hypothetical protein
MSRRKGKCAVLLSRGKFTRHNRTPGHPLIPACLKRGANYWWLSVSVCETKRTPGDGLPSAHLRKPVAGHFEQPKHQSNEKIFSDKYVSG